MQYAEALRPYFGALLIFGGLVMVFVGAKLVEVIFSAVVGFTVAVLLFFVFYNVLLPPGTPGYALIICGVLSLVVAGFSAYFSRRFAQKYAVPLIAGWGGIVLALIVAEIGGITNATATVVMALALGVAGFFAGNCMNRLVKCSVTAFVGAGIAMKGVSFYVLDFAAYNGDNVSVEAVQDDKTLWILIGSLLVLFITGTIVQLRFTRDENKDDGDYTAMEDEARVCGCF